MSTPPRPNRPPQEEAPRAPQRRPRRRRTAQPPRDDDDESKEGDDRDETKDEDIEAGLSFEAKLDDEAIKDAQKNPGRKGNDKKPQPLLVTPSLLLF